MNMWFEMMTHFSGVSGMHSCARRLKSYGVHVTACHRLERFAQETKSSWIFDPAVLCGLLYTIENGQCSVRRFVGGRRRRYKVSGNARGIRKKVEVSKRKARRKQRLRVGGGLESTRLEYMLAFVVGYTERLFVK